VPTQRRLTLTHWILLSMLLGIAIGFFFPHQSQNLKVISNLFLRMIKCILVPLVFSTLVVGIASHSDDLKAVGRIALKAILYFEAVTTLALLIGWGAATLVQPGRGVKLPPPQNTAEKVAPARVTAAAIIEHLAPRSFFEAAAENDVLQVVFFAIIFGISLAQVRGKPHDTVLAFFEGLTEVMFKFTGTIMLFAPFGIGAAMAVTIGHSGLTVLANLAKLILTLYGALFAFCLLVLLPIAKFAGIPVLEFLRIMKDPALLAFTTTSSDAAMPGAMKRLIDFGVPKHIVSFVMPLGYSFNLDGSTLYLAVSSMFIAQAAGAHLPWEKQLLIIVTLMLTSKGMAGIPRASQVILAGTLVTFDLPLEGVLLIIGVDELMDMARTTVNLIGNSLSTAIIARWEGQFRTSPTVSSTTP
jgi:proton glutamate symport protein